MSKRIGGQAAGLFQSTEAPKDRTAKARKAPEAPKAETAVSLPATEKRKKNGAPSKQGQGGGRPKKDRPEAKRFTVVLTLDSWETLSKQAALAKVNEGVETDRSGVLRALVSKLERGEIALRAKDFTE